MYKGLHHALMYHYSKIIVPIHQMFFSLFIELEMKNVTLPQFIAFTFLIKFLNSSGTNGINKTEYTPFPFKSSFS